MFNTIIKFSLNHRFIVLVFAAILLVVGGWQATRLPVDVLPDLSRPRVIVITECRGMAPEEVESLVTMPIEMYLNADKLKRFLRRSPKLFAKNECKNYVKHAGYTV